MKYQVHELQLESKQPGEWFKIAKMVIFHVRILTWWVRIIKPVNQSPDIPFLRDSADGTFLFYFWQRALSENGYRLLSFTWKLVVNNGTISTDFQTKAYQSSEMNSIDNSSPKAVSLVINNLFSGIF